jgi:iron-sulfur cluster assembly accessory protein
MSTDLATEPTTAPNGQPAPAPSAPSSAQASTAQASTDQTVAAHTARDGKGILISEPAMKQLAALVRQEGTEKVLRVGVRSGGCSGMSYTMDFVETSDIRDDDACYVYEPADSPSFQVVCDPKSLLYIYGMQLDFSSALIGGGFNFSNPNATQTCGCGSSFAV